MSGARVGSGMKRGSFGIGIMYPKVEENIGSLLRNATVWGADFVFFIGGRPNVKQATDTTKAVNHKPIFFLDSFDEARGLFWQYEFVAIEQGGKSLNEFIHPRQAVYLLGSEGAGLPVDVMNSCNHIVEIESLHPISINVAQAGGIVLHNRFVQ